MLSISWLKPNCVMCCLVMPEHLALGMTLAQGTSISPSCFLPRRRRPRCVVVVVVVVVAFLCRRCLLRCVAVAIVVVVAWVELPFAFVVVLAPLGRLCLELVLFSCRRRRRRGLRRRRRQPQFVLIASSSSSSSSVVAAVLVA